MRKKSEEKQQKTAIAPQKSQDSLQRTFILDRCLTPNSPLRDIYWKMPPFTFWQFLKIIGHSLTPYQKEVFGRLLPTTADEFFVDRKGKKQETVLLWGKGSGKDYTISLYISWLAYLLTATPEIRLVIGRQKYPLNMPIHIVAVAANFPQAQMVLYSYLAPILANKQMFAGWSIPKQSAYHEELNIHIRPLHSLAQSWEGLNPLFWVMDEASGYPTGNAHTVYNILQSSAKTRFPDNYQGVILSYPRFPRREDDFTLDCYYRAIEGLAPNMSADKAPTWVVRGQDKDIYAPEFERDYAGAMLRLACEPVTAENAVFDPAKVVFAGETEFSLTNMSTKDIPPGLYSIGIDAGFRHSYFGVCVMRKESRYARIVGLHRFAPQQASTLEILASLRTLQDILGCPVVGDSYHSELFAMQLNFIEKHITTSFYKNEFMLFRNAVHNGEIIFPKSGYFADELRSELFSAYFDKGMVRFPSEGTKDMLDAAVMAYLGLIEQDTGNVYSI